MFHAVNRLVITNQELLSPDTQQIVCHLGLLETDICTHLAEQVSLQPFLIIADGCSVPGVQFSGYISFWHMCERKTLCGRITLPIWYFRNSWDLNYHGAVLLKWEIYSVYTTNPWRDKCAYIIGTIRKVNNKPGHHFLSSSVLVVWWCFKDESR